MNTLRDMNRLLVSAISSLMTEKQLDTALGNGMTARQLLAKSALVYTTILPDEDKVLGRPAAAHSEIKAYWHHHGYISPTKPNAEWVPLVVKD